MNCAPTTICEDNSCLCFCKHFTCSNCNYHLGDRVQNKKNNKLGYIYDVNPLKSKRSLVVKYDDNSLEKLFGFYACGTLIKLEEPRDLSKVNPKYN